MDWTGTICVTVVTMLAVIASIVRDVRAYRRLGSAGTGLALAPAIDASLPADASVPASPATPAGRAGDADAMRELTERLGALRVLGLEYVRSAHPLFRGDATPDGTSAGNPAPALGLKEPVEAVIADAAPAPSGAKRRPRHGRLRSTAALRLVVDHDRPQG